VAATDHYETSRANLRDTVKWLATTVGALVAAIMAGASFSKLGAIDAWSARFFAAWAGLVAGTGSLFAIWWQLLHMLRSEAVFPAQLRESYRHPVDAPKWERREFKDLREHLRTRNGVLTAEIGTFDALAARRGEAWEYWRREPDNAWLREAYQRYDDSVKTYVSYATLVRLNQRVESRIDWIAALTILAAIALFVFAYAANPPSTSSGRAVRSGSTSSVMAHVFPPIYFARESANPAPTALEAVGAVRSLFVATKRRLASCYVRGSTRRAAETAPVAARPPWSGAPRSGANFSRVMGSRHHECSRRTWRARMAPPKAPTSAVDIDALRVLVVAVPISK
jgi:hypothetical protein